MKRWIPLLLLAHLISHGLNAPAQGFVWASQIGSQQIESGSTLTKVAVDQAGNVYLSGSFQGTANFGATNLSSAGGTDAFLAKYSSNGQFLWVRQF